MSPYFSKASVRRLEPVLQQALKSLLKRVSACAKGGDVMPMNDAYKAATSDVITAYCFGESVNYLEKDDYNVSFFEAVAAMFQMCWWIMHIPLLGRLMSCIPEPPLGLMMPGLKSMSQMQRVSSLALVTETYSPIDQQWARQIKELGESKDLEKHDVTIFHGLLNSSLPPSDKSPNRLQQEAQMLVIAGLDTTGQCTVPAPCSLYH